MRVFLNWDKAANEKVAEYLLPEKSSQPVDFHDTLIIVPTRQAGRRLQKMLAQRAPILSPRIEVPSYLLKPDPAFSNIATPSESLAAWHDVLLNEPLEAYSSLFPLPPSKKNITWTLQTAEAIQQLRRVLVDNGFRIADVASREMEEPERWRDLARLESRYIERMKKINRYDPFAHMIKQARKPLIPEHCQRIILAAVPDPSPVVLEALKHISEKISTIVLVHAPDHLKDHFDEWGRPEYEAWKNFAIQSPLGENDLNLCKDPFAQAQFVLDSLEKETVVCVPDEEVGMALSTVLPTFDPAGKSLITHSVFQLISTLHTLLENHAYPNVRSCLRQVDILKFLKVDPEKFLNKLDDYQNNHLPATLEDIPFPELDTLREIVEHLKKNPLPVIRSLLEKIYEDQRIDPQTEKGESFMKVAKTVNGLLEEMENVQGPVFPLLIHQLKKEKYVVRPDRDHLDLEGWLELAWNNAPFLMLTGMNEGSIPSSSSSDPFLPQQARKKLGLRDNNDRYARDVYLLATLLANREKKGRVLITAGKFSTNGDPLKPSRLLFQCEPAEMMRRAKILLSEPLNTDVEINCSNNLKLTIPLPSTFPIPDHIGITAFKDFLTCPFRFYLKHILNMKEKDDLKVEMDALDVGAGIHFALEGLAESGAGETEILDRFYEWMRERFGNKLPLPLQIQLDTTIHRLQAAVRVHEEDYRKGWKLLEAEKKMELKINGINVRGKIDRIDQHEQSGALRILDYKTFDSFTSIESLYFQTPRPHIRKYMLLTHPKKKEKAWADLQLPLYSLAHPEKKMQYRHFYAPKNAQRHWYLYLGKL